MSKAAVEGGLGEVGPVGLEQSEVGVDGGDGDVDLVGDLFEGVAVLPELVIAECASASAW